MSVIKSIKSFLTADSPDTQLNIHLGSFTEVMEPALCYKFVEELSKRMADEYMKIHAPEILKRIQEQTTDAKVIQKVVANLRKELSPKKDLK